MNLFEQYIQKKNELDKLRQQIIDKVLDYKFYSAETILIFDCIAKHPDGNTQRKVAQLTGLSINTIATVVLKLEERGLITNEKDENDTSDRILKRKLLKPTDKGKEVYTQLMQQFETTK